MASFILTASGEVVTMTSSSCIIMSEPMVFCSDIECSGVRSLYAVRTGILQTLSRCGLHWCPIMGAREAYTFFRDFG